MRRRGGLFFIGGESMSVPLDLNLIQCLLSARSVTDDLDNIKTPGFYYLNKIDANFGTWPFLIVLSGTDITSLVQIGIADGGGTDFVYSRFKYREFYSDRWSNWQTIATLDDLPNLSDYAKKSDLPNLSNYVTMAQVTAEVTRVLTTAEF